MTTVPPPGESRSPQGDGSHSREPSGRGDVERFELIRGAAVIADTPLTGDEVIERLRALLTPGFAETFEITLGETAEPLHGREAVVVPLRSRGHDIGTMRLAHRTRGYDAGDFDFAHLIAGRAALALENAQLAVRETHLTTALDSLAEAVTIQDAESGLIYANDAAAAALGFASAQELLATAPEAIIDAYESFLPNGAPLTLEDLPGRQVLKGELPGPLTVRAIHKQTREERFRIIKATPVPGHPSLAVNVIEDVTDVTVAERAQRFLAQAGVVLASSLDYEQTLQRIARLAVPRLADWCAVSLPEGHVFRTVAVAHADPAKLEAVHAYQASYPVPVASSTGSATVLRTGASQVVNDAQLDKLTDDPVRREALAALGLHSVLIVPMTVGGRVIGTIAFVSAESRKVFTDADRRLGEELGRRAGAAVENARLYRERTHIARTLQRGLLPDALPDIPGMRLSSLYRPAGEENLVGGDFYDAFPTPQGWMLLVGDVTGRGAEAAAQTGQARHTLRTAGMLLGDPTRALEQLNRALADRRALTPCTVAIVHVTARTSEILCAGHPQPLLIRGGEPHPVGPSGPMLGAWPDSTWRADTLDLQPGDVLVLYTDGVTDARGADGRFGEARLLEALRGSEDAAAAVAAIDRALNHFQRGPQADDTAVLALDLPPGRS